MAVICRKVGNSITATIPGEIVKLLGIIPGDKFEVSTDNKSVTFTPVKKKLRGELFLEQYYEKPLTDIGDFGTELLDWGSPEGDEEW